VAICCSPPPEGRARWTLDLLVGELTGRKIVTSVCAETVRRALKKTSCSPGARSPGASPRKIGLGSLPRWRSCLIRTRPSIAPRSR
jgi:hypothetical protein